MDSRFHGNDKPGSLRAKRPNDVGYGYIIVESVRVQGCMPTVLRKDGFDFRMYFDDHIPAHIHAFKGEGEVKISLGDSLTQPAVSVAYNISKKEAKQALAIVLEYQTELLKRWVEMHG